MTTEVTVTASASSPAIGRLPDLAGWLRKKSHFLFGPRQTGKSFLIRQLLPNARGPRPPT